MTNVHRLSDSAPLVPTALAALVPSLAESLDRLGDNQHLIMALRDGA